MNSDRDDRNPRDILAEHIPVRERTGADLQAEPDEDWTPPALNDNRKLKAQIMAAMKGEPDPYAQAPDPDQEAGLTDDTQAGIHRLNRDN